MEETKLRQLFKNRADAYLNTIDESVEQGMSEDCFIKAVNEAINYTHSCKSDSEQLPSFLYKSDDGLYFKHSSSLFTIEQWNKYLKTR